MCCNPHISRRKWGGPGAVLVTADRRYFAKARQEGRIQLLSDLADDFVASREIHP